MPSIGALDVPYGSQVQIVRTTYACVEAASGSLVSTAANLLELLQTEMNGSATRPDYIIVDGANTASTDPRVLYQDTLTDAMNVPLIGPMQGALGVASGLAGHQNSAADIGTKANGEILAILSVGATRATYGTPAAGAATIPTYANLILDPAGADSVEAHLMSSAMTLAAGGQTGLISLGGANNLAVDLFASSNTIDFSDANLLDAGFVHPGNSAGTTRTFTGDVVSSGDTVTLLTVTALVKAA
jgi:hypothetical protein